MELTPLERSELEAALKHRYEVVAWAGGYYRRGQGMAPELIADQQNRLKAIDSLLEKLGLDEVIAERRRLAAQFVQLIKDAT